MTPLAGKRIVDFSRYAPGPYATLLCAALGAEVVKVEAPPDGDPLRALDPRAFERLNAGKKSVVLDLLSEGDVGDARKLIERADVVIESFRPGIMERFGLDYTRARELRSSLVYVSISGYGQAGPYASRAGHDVNYMAVAGALDGVDKPLPIQFADFAAGGLFAVIGILSAVQEGTGRYLDLSMHDGLLSLALLADGTVGPALSGSFPNYHIYRTKDGRGLSVGALEPKFWTAFCDGIGRPELSSRAEDASIRTEVQSVVETRSALAWQRVFETTDACVEIVHTHDEALEHPQARHRATSAPGPGPRLPFGFRGSDLAPAPRLGEHSDEIRRTLG